jgi:hypothetical protein
VPGSGLALSGEPVTFSIFSCFLHPTSCFKPPNKGVILSEALRRSIANREFYGAESKDPGDACWRMLLRAFRPRTAKDNKKSQPRRISTRRSTRQDAQINYLSTLSIFMKQTTYLATLPNPKSEANECVYDGAVLDGSRSRFGPGGKGGQPSGCPLSPLSPILQPSGSKQFIQLETINLKKRPCRVHRDQKQPDHAFLTCDGAIELS